MVTIDLVDGQVVERFTVLKRIGKGGAAWVYKVRHNTLGSLHALKVLRDFDEAMPARFVQEGQVQASLRHPNIIAVTDVVMIGESPGLIMDYIDGPSLGRWLRRNRPSLEQAEAIFRGIVAGVGRAHRLGLVHRDLKPANVLMATDDDGELVPKVADFGLAKILSETGTDDEGPSHTVAGTTLGTPAYMAPEQVRDSKSVDRRADIFALGCILYELCTGASPFNHPEVFAIFAALEQGHYTPPQALVPDLPPRFCNAINGCLANDRDQRIHSCSLLLQVLDGTVTDEWASLTFSAERPSPPGRERPVAERPSPHRISVAGGVAVAAVAMVGGMGVVLTLLIAATVGWSRLRTPPAEQVTVPEPAPVAEAPAPEVEEPEAVTPPVPAEPAAPSTGQVSVTGDADDVWLEGPDGRIALGVVPAGQYRILASFKGRPAQSAGRVTVRPDQRVVVKCSAAFQACQAR